MTTTENDARAYLLKSQLLRHLKSKRSNLSEILDLWGETKSYFNDRGFEMGGSFASWGKDISVHVVVKGESIRFIVSLDEVNNEA